MIQFKKEILTNDKLAVCCDTRAEILNLFQWADYNGKQWVNGESYLLRAKIFTYNSLCINEKSVELKEIFCIANGTQCSIEDYKSSGFTVLTYDEALEMSENVVKEKTITYRNLLEKYLDTVNAFCEKIGNEDTNYIEDIIGNTNIEEIFNSVKQGTPWNCIASDNDIKENESAINCRIQELAIETINELKADIVQPIGELIIESSNIQLRYIGCEDGNFYIVYDAFENSILNIVDDVLKSALLVFSNAI